MTRKLHQNLIDFLNSFERVFHEDWDVSSSRLGNEFNINPYIDPHGTFLNPGVEDESNNWANRGALLFFYRLLMKTMQEEGLLDLAEPPGSTSATQ